jgi:CPA2 family monovalent cation:H+ antiporter-2
VLVASAINIAAYSDALVLLGTAGILIPIFRRWGFNPVLGYLAAGAILGPYGLGAFASQFHFLFWFTVANAGSISGIAELGIVFLLFVIGLELSLERLSRMRLLVGGLGGLQVVLSAVVIMGVALAMGESHVSALLLGASLSLSSTAIVLSILERQKRMAAHAGRAIFAVLLAQDMAAIPILMFVSIGAASSSGLVLMELGRALVQAAMAIAVIVLFGRHLTRPLFRLVAAAHSAELFVAAVLFVIVSAGVIASQAGLSMGMGAFIAGLLLAGSAFEKAIQASIEPVKDLLLGVFFFTVGMRVDAGALIREPLLLLGCVVGLIAIKAAILIPLARLFRLSWPSAIETGLVLGPGGEFAFVILGLAADLGLVGARTSGLALAVTSLSMATTPGLSAVAGRIRRRLQRMEPLATELAQTPPRHSGQAIVVGYGRVGQVVCGLLERMGLAYIATDRDPEVVLEGRRQGHPVYFGNVREPSFLRTCGLAGASCVIVTVNSREVADGIVTMVRWLRSDVPVIVRARDAEHACHLYKLGASEVVPETIEASLQLSQAALVGLGVKQSAAAEAVEQERHRYRDQMTQIEESGHTR